LKSFFSPNIINLKGIIINRKIKINNVLSLIKILYNVNSFN
jgi:hypothetical protein